MDLGRSENKRLNADVLEGIQILCRIFFGPDLALCRQMIKGDFFHSFESIFARADNTPVDFIDKIKSIINEFDTYQFLFDHLNQCHVRLFVNSKEGITAPLYESCYEFENAPMMGSAAVKMNQCFDAKGLSMENRVHEPPDHIAIELEYLFFLIKEDPDGFIPTAAASFASEIMLPWVMVFNRRLKSVDETCKFYSLASEILVLLLLLISSKK